MMRKSIKRTVAIRVVAALVSILLFSCLTTYNIFRIHMYRLFVLLITVQNAINNPLGIVFHKIIPLVLLSYAAVVKRLSHLSLTVAGQAKSPTAAVSGVRHNKTAPPCPDRSALL